MSDISNLNKITIGRAENRVENLTVRDSGIPVDITNHIITFTVKSNPKETANLIQKTSASISEIELVDPTIGRADIKLVPTDTVNIVHGDYVYDVWIEKPTGEQFQIVPVSKFLVRDRVTQL